MTPGERPNILVVDDVEQNVDYIEMIIKKLPINIIKAFSGEEALRKIRNHDLALALIDVQMPQMSGTNGSAVI